MAKNYDVIDSGMYNSVIKGYMIAALEDAGFTSDEIKKACRGLNGAFDEITAKEAETVYDNSIYY